MLAVKWPFDIMPRSGKDVLRERIIPGRSTEAVKADQSGDLLADLAVT